MKRYLPGDFAQLALKIFYCQYSIQAVHEIRSENGHRSAVEENDNWVIDRQNYYNDNFHIHFADVLSFFYKADDQDIFQKLKLTKDDLKEIQELRGVTTHIKGFNEKRNTLLKVLDNPKLPNLINEFFTVWDYLLEIY